MFVEVGTQVRIPSNTESILSEYNELNDLE